MGKKKGRPKKAVKQERQIGFFLTLAQFAVVERKMGEARVNISDYMRQVAVQGEVRAKWTPEEREMVRTLVGMSVRLHDLVVAAQEQPHVPATLPQYPVVANQQVPASN